MQDACLCIGTDNVAGFNQKALAPRATPANESTHPEIQPQSSSAMPILRKSCETDQVSIFQSREQRWARAHIDQYSMRTIRGLLFASQRRNGRGVNVPTLIPRNECATHPRYPSLEVITGFIPGLQETWVDVDAGARPQRFFVAAYYDPLLPANRALKAIVPDVDWHGELIIMRAGTNVFVTSIGTRALAIRAIRK